MPNIKVSAGEGGNFIQVDGGMSEKTETAIRSAITTMVGNVFEIIGNNKKTK